MEEEDAHNADGTMRVQTSLSKRQYELSITQLNLFHKKSGPVSLIIQEKILPWFYTQGQDRTSIVILSLIRLYRYQDTRTLVLTSASALKLVSASDTAV